MLSPQAISYKTSEVPLDFTVNKTVSQITYTLDGQQNVTTGNMTLTGLSNGLHNVTVYATDKAGNVGISQTINFTVAKPEPFSAETIVAVSVVASVVIVVACAGVIVYLRKRKH
jgi:hypothetical protein